jgi:hypothetical protein
VQGSFSKRDGRNKRLLIDGGYSLQWSSIRWYAMEVAMDICHVGRDKRRNGNKNNVNSWLDCHVRKMLIVTRSRGGGEGNEGAAVRNI